MNRNRILPLTAGCIAGGATLLGLICRTVALLKHFDTAVGYYDASAASVTTTVLCFVTVIGMTVCAALLPRENTLPKTRPACARDITGALPLAAFLVFLVVAWIKEPAIRSIHLNPQGQDIHVFTYALLILLAVGGVAYGIHILFGYRNKNAVGGTGFFPILWGLPVIAVIYMDQYIAMNSPLKIGIMFATLGMMVALTAELRYDFGKPAPRAYLVFTGCGAFFCLVGTIPYLIATLAGVLPRHALYPLVCCTVAIMGIFFSVRLAQCLRQCLAPSPVEPDMPEKEDTDVCA